MNSVAPVGIDFHAGDKAHRFIVFGNVGHHIKTSLWISVCFKKKETD